MPSPSLRSVSLAVPTASGKALQRIAQVLRSGQLVQGPAVAAFEERIARRCQRTFAVAVSSGTTALRLTLTALGVRRGHKVLCPSLSWPSPLHAILLCGADPVLVDVDPATWNLPAKSLAQHHDYALAVAQFGNPLDESFCRDNVIEDAACAIGSHGPARAGGALGAVSCLSFHPRKIVTTGEGGMCLTDDPALARELRILRNHGQRSPGAFDRPAGNARMSEIAAALGLAQLDQLDEELRRRSECARLYRELLADSVAFQDAVPGARPNYQTFGILLPPHRADAKAFVAHMAKRDVACGRLSYALHRLPYAKGGHFTTSSRQVRPSSRDARRGESVSGTASDRDFPVASRLEDAGVALPMHGQLRPSDLRRVAEGLQRFLG